ncbi:MAG: VOC family protein [Chloroflexi bacterium]|nr:VOC family protein [Chloroflexota bacterium]
MEITHLTLLAQDLSAQHQFYTQVLGLPMLEGGEEVITFGVGRSKLTFLQADEDWSGTYHFAFNIPENQFAQAKAWLTERVSLIHNPAGEDEFRFESWNAHAIYFYDLAGNILEFIARHDLRNASDAPFSHESLLAISEIGLTTPDVAATMRQLQSYLPLKVYRNSESEDFTALGDANGLLIIVKKGRIWWPETGVPASLAAVSILSMDSNGQGFQISGPPYDISPMLA